LILNEYMLLEILKGCPGVEQAHGLLVDYVQDEKSKSPAKTKKRITLVLDPSSDKSCENWMNINQVNYNISLHLRDTDTVACDTGKKISAHSLTHSLTHSLRS
jgi:hypothetical protein